MIFITLGNQNFQFSRLLKKIDSLVVSKIIQEPVIAQTGHTIYIGNAIQTFDFLEQEIFLDYIDKANLIITHAGTGSIINSLKKGKKLIAAARLSNYEEHIDDHQIEILEAFTSKNMILGLNNELSDLELKIKMSKDFVPVPFHSNNDVFNKKLIKIIDNFT
jgi:UDP-N-acetylglucosamine transferase subunit ALG13